MSPPSHVAAKSTDSTLLSRVKQALLFAVPSLILVSVFEQSATWHLHRFWRASGDFWQGLWDHVIDKVGDDPFTLYVWGTFITITVFYWVWASMFTLLDLTLKPAALRKYKSQPGLNEPLHPRRLKKVIVAVLTNQFLLNLPVIAVGFVFFQLRGFPDVHKLPSLQRILLDIAFFTFKYEIMFYYCHRLMHSKYLYRRVHKMHHEWTSPVGLATMYAHPVEHFVCNIGPMILGPILMGSHVFTLWLWFNVSIFVSIIDHSGYHFPLLGSNEFHDFHHISYTECFGALGILDRLHQTDTVFRSSGIIRRHNILTSLTPMTQLYPLADTSKIKLKRRLIQSEEKR